MPAETVEVKLSSAFPGILPSVKGIFFTRIPFSMKAWQMMCKVQAKPDVPMVPLSDPTSRTLDEFSW